ncbi:MAG: HAMP domain-containing histidine kinase [Pirellulales bacterium]|nr:HAMP domain-containing histidine kinase [Pirellulales bacterium]
MLRHWPIRTKLQVGLGLLLVAVLALFGSALFGLHAYRGLLHSVAARSAELPLASDVRQNVSNLRVTLSRAGERLYLPTTFASSSQSTSKSAYDSNNDGVIDAYDYAPLDMQELRYAYVAQLNLLAESLANYRDQWEENKHEADQGLGDDLGEGKTLAAIENRIAALREEDAHGQEWLLDHVQLGRIRGEVDKLAADVAALPSHLHNRFRALAGDMRARYRTALVVSWFTAVVSLVVLSGAGRVFYKWFAHPLETLVDGSRKVAAGDFRHRIRLATRDEMGELADAMNAMTQRFCEINDSLNEQVREQASQMVRSAQLASVGFLAAGVSHEINNPLASIALCSESLESRLQELLASAGPDRAADVEVARNYLQMIQREAFRCKQITEKLLDFARRGDSQRANVELRELTAGVIEMVDHLGRYRDRRVELLAGPPVVAAVNAQEIKQVILNLVTNALESMDADGTARIEIGSNALQATIAVSDTGCGLSDEVRKHLFEPFFTRRKNGQGTGLGLSITHRIVEDHGGRITAESEGPGRGSRFTVALPLAAAYKESHHRRQAA